ncbi:HK97 family phage prohead protease [Dehalococcoides mccartyi]|jgi:phage prohead protease, HK97 family|uniref:HK97 family phage prohead protease n=1 Tax=Dehalococcoides mccartyi TaxID=61435 RepID=UPI0009902EE3|nr:HK97 family phage prohead protease [Dehalococcoides mccartyi]AQU06100.1 hypothetical protein B1777_05295 [Dehalococcoides mccartyi]AQU07543.1 hypothetical protein B1778_05095 [Dehalococcoides mccartyi]AQX74789.1 hypothetical protein B1776_04390 [Dehalococcoides mccartyi]AQY73366.1 hypothetical protein B1772_04700 [Dehalococcoides mccartyi]QBX64066.1 HK97 family phage prohead protease [Dehalococcoides mccartyi]
MPKTKPEYVTRSYDVTELRAEADSEGTPKIKGHAAVFNKQSVALVGFREQILPGAFAKTITKSDIRALWNHDPNYVLGRNKSDTLRLVEDEKGLSIEIDPPDTQWARDLMVSIKRGDVSQMSFGFHVIKDHWDNDNSLRTLVEVELFDVSPVTYPAYPQTDVSVRSALTEAGIDYNNLSTIITRTSHQIPLTQTDYDNLNTAINVLRSYLPKEEHPVQPGSRTDGCVAEVEILRRQLELVKYG